MSATPCWAVAAARPSSFRGRLGRAAAPPAGRGLPVAQVHADRAAGATAATRRRTIRVRIAAVAEAQEPREVLPPLARVKLDPSSDRLFYAQPRLVHHLDAQFRGRLTELYRRRIPAGADLLDVCSSWASHLPPEVEYRRVVGVGMNAAELARNPRLTSFFVRDLNEDSSPLELADQSFDAILCTAGLQYLQAGPSIGLLRAWMPLRVILFSSCLAHALTIDIHAPIIATQFPERVVADWHRLLRPGGVAIVSFSNRMFYSKAFRAWRDGSDYSRCNLVVDLFASVPGGFMPAAVLRARDLPGAAPAAPEGPFAALAEAAARLLGGGGGDQAAGGDPFYAVVACRRGDEP